MNSVWYGYAWIQTIFLRYRPLKLFTFFWIVRCTMSMFGIWNLLTKSDTANINSFLCLPFSIVCIKSIYPLFLLSFAPNIKIASACGIWHIFSGSVAACAYSASYNNHNIAHEYSWIQLEFSTVERTNSRKCIEMCFVITKFSNSNICRLKLLDKSHYIVVRIVESHCMYLIVII